jgi:hypothetical protein
LLVSTCVRAAEIECGIAQADITPPVGGDTTGYQSAEPTDGVHDPVSARVLVLKSRASNLSVALVSCDLCVFNSSRLYRQLDERRDELGIDHLLLMNTHTHAGPSMRQDDFPSAEQPWRKTVEQRILTAIEEAKKNLFPAYLAAGEGYLQLGYNRLVQRGPHAVTHFENPDRIPYGEVDPTVGVIRVSDEDSQVRAVLVHYACHPVVLGPRNRKISADYPGVLRGVIERHAGRGAMCMFVQGGGGDINPLIMARGDDRGSDFELVERTGQLLADEVLRVLALLEDQPGRSDELLIASSELDFADRWQPQDRVTLGVATLLINGEIGIVTLPGEPFHLFQVDWRERSGLPHAYLFGYCSNGPYPWPRYLPDLLSAARGGYGASDTTRAEPGAGERLVNRGLAQLLQLQGRLKEQPQRHTFE